jgi:predicted dehydrogenase
MDKDFRNSESRTRYALIGCGASIAGPHLDALSKLPTAEVVAMSDIDVERGHERAKEAGCPFFADHIVLLKELRPDVAVICTPHPGHATVAKDCFLAGAHVLVEKPIAVDVAEADEMIAASERAGRLLGVNFQERFRPSIEYAREFVAKGGVGRILRVLSVEPWLRTAEYYRSSSWRGTWKGEGGGVLLNQSPHTLDVLCHLVGLPSKVWGVTRTRMHAIEAEDSAQAMLEYENGAFGYLAVSTAEAGADKRLEIVGDRAILKIVGETLTIVRFDSPLRDHIALAKNGFIQPGTQTEVVELPSSEGRGHVAVHADFHSAIREGRRPRCDGPDGLMSLELANAITLSSFTERAVSLPLDRAAYSKLLHRLRGGRD